MGGRRSLCVEIKLVEVEDWWREVSTKEEEDQQVSVQNPSPSQWSRLYSRGMSAL